MREGMDDIFYSRVRLAVVAHLLQTEWVSFTDLQSSAEVTRGNLASHLAKLIASGAIEEDKRIVNQRPLTRYRLTRDGRAAFLEHMTQVQRVFEAVRLEYAEADAAAASGTAMKKIKRAVPATKH